MSDTDTHPWSRLPDERANTHPQVWSTPQQVLRGLEIGRATQDVLCTGCRGSLTEGETGWVYASRRVDAPEWEIARCYCRLCAPRRIETPTLGVSEVLITATFEVCSQAHGQVHHLCLRNVELVDRSPPSEAGPV